MGSPGEKWQIMQQVQEYMKTKGPNENGHFSDSGDDDPGEDPVLYTGRVMTEDELLVSRLRNALVQVRRRRCCSPLARTARLRVMARCSGWLPAPQLTDVFLKQKRWLEAEPLMREAYTLRESDRDHMVVFNRLGTICSALGRHYEAEG